MFYWFYTSHLSVTRVAVEDSRQDFRFSPGANECHFDNGPRGLTFTWWGCRGLCFWHNPAEFVHSFLFCSCVHICVYGPFNCISVHKFSRQLFTFSLCSSGLISALLVLSTIYLFIKVSLSPDIILCGSLGSKHQLTNFDNAVKPITKALRSTTLATHAKLQINARSIIFDGVATSPQCWVFLTPPLPLRTSWGTLCRQHEKYTHFCLMFMSLPW